MSPTFDFLENIDEIYVTSRYLGEMSGTLPTKLPGIHVPVFIVKNLFVNSVESIYNLQNNSYVPLIFLKYVVGYHFTRGLKLLPFKVHYPPNPFSPYKNLLTLISVLPSLFMCMKPIHGIFIVLSLN